jgi:hypothetical protein
VEVRAAEPVPGCTCEAQRTFELEGHHFALVHITGLPAGRDTPYEVVLDGERAWPPPAGRLGLARELHQATHRVRPAARLLRLLPRRLSAGSALDAA